MPLRGPTNNGAVRPLCEENGDISSWAADVAAVDSAEAALCGGDIRPTSAGYFEENGDILWWAADVAAVDSAEAALCGGDIRPTFAGYFQVRRHACRRR